ncbi:hypothetical protein KC360_g181 [Hortaea werneckii]|nr:hypothetical protein KC344_g186 [Hortaea werneckii]KAI7180471.1 hypothetical protein KC360_g181 [Hortaea werneckii]
MPVDKVDDEVVEYLPEIIPPLDSEESEQDEEEQEALSNVEEGQQIKKGGWQCPYENCARHYEFYGQRWRWREHLKRTHKLNGQQMEEVEAELNQPGDSHIAVDAEPDVDARLENEMEIDDDDALVGSVHVDGFLKPLLGDYGRGTDRKTRRRRSTAERGSSKRARLAESEEGE